MSLLPVANGSNYFVTLVLMFAVHCCLLMKLLFRLFFLKSRRQWSEDSCPAFTSAFFNSSVTVSRTGQGCSPQSKTYLEGAMGEAVLRDWIVLIFCASQLVFEILVPPAVYLSTNLCYTKCQYFYLVVGILIFPEIGHCLSLVLYEGKGWTSKLNLPFQG